MREGGLRGGVGAGCAGYGVGVDGCGGAETEDFVVVLGDCYGWEGDCGGRSGEEEGNDV